MVSFLASQLGRFYQRALESDKTDSLFSGAVLRLGMDCHLSCLFLGGGWPFIQIPNPPIYFDVNRRGLVRALTPSQERRTMESAWICTSFSSRTSISLAPPNLSARKKCTLEGSGPTRISCGTCPSASILEHIRVSTWWTCSISFLVFHLQHTCLLVDLAVID